MKSILFLFLLFSMMAKAQSLKKYPIDDSGCSVYMFCQPGDFTKSYGVDSSAIYSAECELDSVTYGLICIRIKNPVQTGKDAEDLLLRFLDNLKESLEIKSSVGYGKGHIMEKKPDAQGIIDYWKDAENTEWKIKGWIDGKILAVLYVFKANSIDEQPRHNVFLNGFRFPGM